jgi:hypothetical protein
MSLVNRAASTIVLVTLISCGGGGTSTPPGQQTAAGCVAGSERIAKIAGDGQTAAPGTLLPERPAVRVTCESFANRGTTMPMAGAAVQWQVLTRGSVDGATTVPKQLDADGITSVAWTLPNGFGAQAVRVALVAPNPPLGVEFDAAVAASTTTAQSCQDAGGTEHGASIVIAADAAWTAADSPHRGGTITLDNGAVLSIEAGSVVCVAAIDRLNDTGTLVAHGSGDKPIRFFGTALRIADDLRHVRAENVPTVGSSRPASRIEDSTFRWSEERNPLMCAQIVVGGSDLDAGVTLRRTLIERYGSSDCAALRVIHESCCWWDYGPTSVDLRIVGSVGDAVSVLPGAALFFTNCEVSGSGRHGIVVSASGDPVTESAVVIHGCNLFGNDGKAVINEATASIDAQGNWWGDAAGSSGPNADGVSGVVDVAHPLAAPATLSF